MGRLSILVIEDDRDILEILTYSLGEAGYDVLTAEDGELGLRLALQKRPNLVLLDVGLPKIGGLDVCRALRENPDKSIAKIPIVMLTALTSDVDRVIGKVLGANSYLNKPFSSVELIDHISRHIHAAQTSFETSFGTR